MPPPPGIIFPPGIPPSASPAAASLTSTEEIWVENKSPEGKVSVSTFAVCISICIAVSYILTVFIVFMQPIMLF